MCNNPLAPTVCHDTRRRRPEQRVDRDDGDGCQDHYWLNWCARIGVHGICLHREATANIWIYLKILEYAKEAEGCASFGLGYCYDLDYLVI